ncbi:MAG TPA: hypothetical protein VGG29_05380 [Caulobacteraceae bacterium]|jgi:hypothetical protein
MIKRLVAASAALASVAALAAPAYAAPVQPSVTTFTINGSVPATCNLANFSAASKNQILLGTAASNALGSASMIDSSTGKLNAKAVTVDVGANWCNGVNTKISITPTRLTTGAAAPSGFDNFVDYTLTTTFTEGQLDTQLNQTVTNATLGAFTHSDDKFTVTPDVTSDLLVAGSYTGNIVVTVTPTA